jgi:asparagine synthase (glutamine-hydrolysing)
MCGIVGKVSFTKTPVQAHDVARMRDTLSHRGPDDDGIYISPDHTVGLGHRRLSIIDLSARGHQPMNYHDRYWIVFNGEIYNFQELRQQLQAEGYSFESDSDTAVILALYAKHGPACVNYLRGMFAFALYDTRTQQLFCARDRLGKKPFKYYWDGKVFLFASELKAILTQPEYTKELDHTAIHHYLTLQYVPAPLTGFKNIQKLEPAHYLIVDVARGRIQKKRYWQLDFRAKLSLSETEWQQRLMDKLRESVRLRLVADVPLGAFLSGGVDSSAIVGLMSQVADKPVRTFSIGFAEEAYSELPYAREVAQRFGTQHEEFIVKPDAIGVLPKLAYQLEEPFADNSALPTYYLSQLTRQHVTVALNGDGGDENFAGYPRYSIQKFAGWYEKFLPLHTAVVAPAVAAASRLWTSTLLDRAQRFSATLSLPARQRYLAYIGYFLHHQKQDLYTAAWRARALPSTEELIAAVSEQAHATDLIDKTLYTDINTYLPNDLLAKMDITTMAFGLEARSPLLDHEFMELTAQIPSSLKIKGLTERKYIFRQALRPLLPASILDRPKRGFSLPIAVWLRGELKDFLYDVLLSRTATERGIFQPHVVRRLIERHTTTSADYSKSLWVLLMLELWLRRFFNEKI